MQHMLTDQWSVLATLTPSEYALIRPFLATSSGFQSAQYREVEFLLGNKNPDMVKVFAHDPAAQAALEAAARAVASTTSSSPTSPAAGTPSPPSCSTATGRSPTGCTPSWSTTFAEVYAAPEEHWGVYETCEELVDVEDNFQQWRFRHLQVVQRTIGHKTGTGGSSGVDFLRRALDLTFFPELYEVRTRIGELSHGPQPARASASATGCGVPASPSTTPARSSADRFWLSLALRLDRLDHELEADDRAQLALDVLHRGVVDRPRRLPALLVTVGEVADVPAQPVDVVVQPDGAAQRGRPSSSRSAPRGRARSWRRRRTVTRRRPGR